MYRTFAITPSKPVAHRDGVGGGRKPRFGYDAAARRRVHSSAQGFPTDQPKRCSAFFVLLFLVLRVLRHLGVAKPVEAAAGPTTVRDRTGCCLPVKRQDP